MQRPHSGLVSCLAQVTSAPQSQCGLRKPVVPAKAGPPILHRNALWRPRYSSGASTRRFLGVGPSLGDTPRSLSTLQYHGDCHEPEESVRRAAAAGRALVGLGHVDAAVDQRPAHLTVRRTFALYHSPTNAGSHDPAFVCPCTADGFERAGHAADRHTVAVSPPPTSSVHT